MSEVAIRKHELPDSWAVAPLGEVIQLQYGKGLTAKTRVESGDVPVFGSSGDVGRHNEAYINEPCIIVGRKGNVGHIFISHKPCWPIDTVYYVIPPQGVDIKYLYYQLKNLNLARLDKSTAIPGINRNDAYKVDFNLAPIEQQKRIVAKIEELFSHIDAGIEALNKAKQLLKQYRQSVLKAAVTGELLGYKFSEEMFKPIDFGLETLGQGWSPRCEKEPSTSEDTWGVIKTTAVQSLEYRQEENKRLPDSLEPRPKHEILVGDLLVTRAGPRVRVGICCLVKETRKKLMICDKVYRLRVQKDVILPEYLALILNAPNVLIEVEKLKSGINDSGVNLTQNKFIQLQIPYPSIEDQQVLIQIVTEKVDSISRLDEEIEKQLLKAEKNRQSILASAFSGGILNAK